MRRDNKGDKKMNATVQDNKYKPLDKTKKSMLSNFIGSCSADIDLNKVRDDWKYEKD